MAAAITVGVAVSPANAEGVAAPDPRQALQAYVTAPDESYAWVKRQEGQFAGCDYVELRLTSQTWRGIPWKHRLFLVKPRNPRNPRNDGSGQALILIGGGRWRDHYDQPVDGNEPTVLPKEAGVVAGVANRLRSPVVVLTHVPFQPIFEGKVEDQIIAHTFDQYLVTRDPTWPLLLPMVKSAVRAMDAAQAFAEKHWALKIEHFTVTGASKRGWTTWLTAAVDPRVNAIAPMVIDMLNIGLQMKHQVEAWGGFSDSIHDYTERNLQERLDSPAGRSLQLIVDPYHYRQSIRQPKLIFLGTNDPYWPLDALNIYWDDLVGRKHIVYVPNADHGLIHAGSPGGISRVLGGIVALHEQALGALKLPDMEWQFTDQGEKLDLLLRSDQSPQVARAWVATSASRDFRAVRWHSFPMQKVAAGSRGPADGNGPSVSKNGGAHAFRYSLRVPHDGFAALFGEAVYPNDGFPYCLSTNVRIVGQEKEKGSRIRER